MPVQHLMKITRVVLPIWASVQTSTTCFMPFILGREYNESCAFCLETIICKGDPLVKSHFSTVPGQYPSSPFIYTCIYEPPS